MSDQPTTGKRRRRRRRGKGSGTNSIKGDAQAKEEVKQPTVAANTFAGRRVARIVPCHMEERTWEVILWACGGNEANAANYVHQVIKAHALKRRPDFTEAMGQFSGSSKNIEQLAEVKYNG